MNDSASPRGIARSSGIIAVGSMLSRITGLGRLAAVALTFGLRPLNDAYGFANESPNMVYELLLGGILTAVLVPTFLAFDEDRDDNGRAAVFGTTLLALFVLTLVAIIAAPLLATIGTSNVDIARRAVQRDVTTQLMRYLLIEIFFYGVFALLAAALNARRKFAAVAFAPALNNVVVVVVFVAANVWFSDRLTLDSAAQSPAFLALLGIGTTLGIVVMTLALVPAARGAGIPLRVRIAPRHPAVVKLLRLSGWTVGYVAANQVALWVVLVLAGRTSGGQAAYLAAYLFFMLPYGVITVSLTTAILPELTAAERSGDSARTVRVYALGLRFVVLAMAIAGVLLAVFARPIVTVSLDYLNFGARSVGLMSDALTGFAVGLPAFAVYLYTLRVFYARQDTRTPFLINLFECGVNVVLALALAPRYGVAGLALSFSLAYSCGAAVAFVQTRRAIGTLGGRPVALGVARSAAAALASAAVGLLIRSVVPNAWAALAFGGVATGATFALVLVALRGDELDLARSVRAPSSGGLAHAGRLRRDTMRTGAHGHARNRRDIT